MPPPYWKGYLKLSLVTCPVAMMPATTDSEKVRFHTLNRATGHRVASRYVDAETGKPFDERDEAKGYPTGQDEYVILEDDEIEAVALESTRTIDVDMFVPRDSIEWAYLDKPHYLMPDGDVGEEAFAVIREAMAASKLVGISRVVLYRRERALMLEPRGKGIVAWTLRYGDEVRDPNPYFAEIEKVKPPTELMELAKQLVKENTKPWSGDMVKDPVQEHLLKLIASKKRRKGKLSREDGTVMKGNVVNLFEALKKSLAGDAGAKKRTN
ncbi:putative DNA repair protein [Bosea sp. LC85]|uniref:non-homologous end joining protein Ku n=1 Tax=Bosea sp. LC85 TaxID=1502851 RepID=UPI0004E31FB6|nr:Ku protein [Bosea sp. LC85]KFC73180.1 putative DNA repair protein [Bosea sp. LC85]